MPCRFIDNDLGKHGNDAPVNPLPSQPVCKRLLNHVSNSALGIRHTNTEGSSGTRFLLASTIRSIFPTWGPFPCVITT